VLISAAVAAAAVTQLSISIKSHTQQHSLTEQQLQSRRYTAAQTLTVDYLLPFLSHTCTRRATLHQLQNCTLQQKYTATTAAAAVAGSTATAAASAAAASTAAV
jgi:hypothetical protein